jgi:hypothetical protein
MDEEYSLVTIVVSSLPRMAAVLFPASVAASAKDVPTPNATTPHTPTAVVLSVRYV